ncbi:hypothetical protein [Actinomyces ruminis]|uniref:hypothetical protein n=1 Tax=Actinomyces ruminis TaxID=1937003 RepID=UPI000B71521A|nr:hypothetical protein [Actinomyces ruminis]
MLGLDELQYIEDADDDIEVTLSTEDDACVLSMLSLPVVGSIDEDFSIKHQDGTYIVDMSGFSDLSDYDSSTMTVAFPGDVIEADANATISGNEANWDNIASLESLQATGWASADQAASTPSASASTEPTDAPTSATGDAAPTPTSEAVAAPADADSDEGHSLLPIVLGIVGLLVIVGVVIAVVVSRNQKKHSVPTAGYPGAGYPAQPYQQAGQTQYGAPQQPYGQQATPSRNSPTPSRNSLTASRAIPSRSNPDSRATATRSSTSPVSRPTASSPATPTAIGDQASPGWLGA